MNNIEKAIQALSELEIDSNETRYQMARIMGIAALQRELTSEPTATEFLQKAKAICDNTHPCDDDCPLNDWCHHEDDMNIADLVRKVMEYQIKEDKDAERK